MVRPALELAWAVAKVGTQSRPPLPAPSRLRPLMKVSRLPGRMLSTIREVADTDDDFRARVVKAADEELLGRPSWLWLVRPDGWEDELAGLIEQAELAEDEATEKRNRGALQRQLDEANAALQKLRAEMLSLNALNAELEEQTAAARKARRAADADLARVRSELDEAVAGQDDLRRTSAELAETIQRLEREGSAALERASRAEVERDAARRQTEELRLALVEAQRQTAAADDAAASLRRNIGELLAAARAAAVDAGVDTAGATPAEESSPAGSFQPAPAESPRLDALGTSSRRDRRVAARLPPATFDASPEAAQYLVRLPDAFLVVDGYNVTLTSWPGTDLPMQRGRLIDALAELVMRAGTEVLVVFDGIDSGNRLQLPSSVRGRMRVRFTGSEIEADEVIIDFVRALPLARPVVVATNDRRVREAVASHGANVISVDQLLSVLGRGSSPAV